MKIVLTLLIAWFCGHALFAQKIVVQSPVFETSEQSMWGGGSSPGLNRNFEIFPEYSVNLPFNTSSFTKLSFSGLDFGAVLDGHVAFGVGPFEFDIAGFSAGNIDVNYPATVRLEMPEDDTYNPGETIVIKSGFQAAPGAELQTAYPEAGSVGLYMGLMFDASFGFTACFIDCTPRLSIIPPPGFSAPSPLYDDRFAFFEVSPEGVTYVCDNSINFPVEHPFQCNLSSGGPPWTISNGAFSGTLDIPYVETTSSVVNNRNLEASGADPYVIPSVNIIELLGYIPPLKAATTIIQGEFTQPIAPDVTGTLRGITIKWAIVSIDLNVPIRQSQEFRFEPRIFTTLTFPDTVDYVIHSMRSGNVPGRGKSLEYEAGDSLSIRFPCNYDFMDVYATHRIKNRFFNKTFDNISLELDFAAFDFELVIDPYVIIPEICIPIPFAGDLCIPEIGFPGVTLDPPPLIDPDPITLISQDFPPYFQDEWELGGFNTVEIAEPFRLKPREREVDFLVQHVTCHGDSTGAIVTTVPGAANPLRYEWSFGSSDANPVDIPAGRHYLKLTDANRCESIEPVEVIEPPAIDIAFTPGAILCNDGATSITAAASGGTGSLDFHWDSGESSPVVSGKSAGTYRLTVTDDAGCSVEDTLTLAEPTPLVALIADAVDPSCAQVFDGSIKLFVEGGTAPYDYAWSNGSSIRDQEHLEGGDYTIQVTDANNCIATDQVTLTAPTLLEASLLKISDVSCFGGDDAALQVNATGGTPPYNYRWYDSLVTLSATVPVVTGLERGSYSVEVTDSRECQVVKNISVMEPVRPLQADIVANPGLCNDEASGSLDLTVQGGTPPYTYVWSDGQTIEDLQYIAAGKYEVTVTDSEGCSYRNKTLLADPPPIRVALSRQDVTCAEETDGKIFIAAIKGGAAPYSITWSTGESGESVSDLAEGTYWVTVSDAFGCSSTETVIIGRSDADCLFIPNAFSPNGDGTNEVWNIRGLKFYPNPVVKVFNKWGNMVFESIGYQDPWDGSYNGKVLEPATYYYFLDLGNGDPVYQGFVMILK